MSLYRNVLTSIKENKEKRLQGEIIAIPWLKLPRLSTALPGITKENYCIVTANQKVNH